MDVVKFFVNYWKSVTPKQASKLRKLLFLMVSLGVLLGVVNTSLIGLINEVMNSDAAMPMIYLWAFVGLTAFLAIASFASARCQDFLFFPIYIDLMRNFMRKFMALPLQTIEKHGAAKYYSILSEDIRTIHGAIISMLFIVLQIVTALCCLVYLAWLSLPVFAWTISLLAIGTFTIRRILASAMALLVIGRHEYGQVIIHHDSIGKGIKSFKLHRKRRHAFFEKLVNPSFVRMTETNIVGHNRFAVGRGVSTILYFFMMGTILFGSLLLFNVETEILSGYALAVLFLLGPIDTVINNSNSIYRAKVAVKNVNNVGFEMCTQEDAGDFCKAGEPLPEWKEICMKDLTYHYGAVDEELGPHDFVLGPINLTIHPGEVIIVAGGNGSGKTTLAKLLAGLYHPVTGSLSYNGVPITDENRDEYRQTFSAVFVEFYLFSELLGLEDIPDLDNKAQKYLEDLKIGDKLNVKDGQLSTTELSQGQRKRLALMITFLEDRPFYIFDEWTAHQDPQFRDLFYTEILPTLKKRGKTVVVITHDDKYYLHGDRILKMDMGKLELDVPATSLKAKQFEITGVPDLQS